jgi:2-dehydro-3-deoxyphosphooctonate aldolase (KDO 8-P synthase)
VLARSALAAGVAGIFAEVHDEPDQALCDSATQLPLDEFESHLEQWIAVDSALKDD